MALGLSRLFNVRLPINFFSPYRAVDAITFWRRWHMTLSSFLRDYLYIPLGGNRKGRARRYVNLMATMVLGGLWHGAGWTFVAWGALHGAYLCINHAWRALRERLRIPALPSVIAGALTFLCVALAWVPFRANDLPTAGRMLRAMVHMPGNLADSALWPLVVRATYAPELSAGGWLAIGLAIVFLAPNAYQLIGREPAKPSTPAAPVASAGLAFAAGVLFFFSLRALMPGQPSPFLYFQF